MHGPLMLYSATQLLIILLLGVFQFFVPRLTRPDVWFAVTVAPSFRSSVEARDLERGYRKMVVIHTVIALLLGIAFFLTRHAALFPIATIWLLLGSTIAFLRARRRVWPHRVTPTTEREASLATRQDTLPGGPLAQLGPFALLGGVALWLADRWDSIPSTIPMHFNASNQVDRWAPKSIGSVFGPIIVGVGMCAFLWLIGAMVTRVRRVRASGAAGASEAKFRRTIRGVMLAAEYLMTITFSLITVAMVTSAKWPLTVLMVLPVIFVIGIVVALAMLGQGGSRLAAAAGTPVGDRTQDACWKAGLLYVNPNDPALFVEKRFGIGYTLNFGHRWAVPILAAMILFPLGLTLIIKLLAH